MQETVKIYRFLPAEWALKSLQTRRLKVSRLKELNDPFEWNIGTASSDAAVRSVARQALDSFLDHMNDQFGIICFSGSVRDPVIWSHYAQSHGGIALEFEHDIVDSLYRVEYLDERPVLNVNHLVQSDFDSSYTRSVLDKALAKKAPSWKYEDEYRVHLNLSEECEMDGALYFRRISDSFLSRVILGVRCTASEADVARSLKQGGFGQGEVEVVRARMSDTAYEIDFESGEGEPRS